jgi:DNA-binding NtrC family response regulator
MIRRGTRSIEGLHLTLVNRGDDALKLLTDADCFDLVLTDVRMPGATGHDVLTRVRELSPDIPVLLMSAVASVEEVLLLQNEGATLFLRKPFGLPELQLMIRHAQRLAGQLRAARGLAQLAPRQESVLPGLTGRSPAFLRSLVHLPMLARTDAPLLIGGETGTGKELVARAAHQLSQRKDGPFVAVNCSALTDSLVDSELFGHQKGSFTGALRDQPGLFRAANNGTIFLDEVGDLAPTAQAKLLRVLQEREVRPVGSVQPVKVNVRVISATHRDLASMVPEGKFRQDLLYRLRVGEVILPSLRDRPDDILLLAHTFLERCRREFGAQAQAFAPDAVATLMGHRWPGNVRELEGTIMRAAAVSTGPAIMQADLGMALGPASDAPSAGAPASDGGVLGVFSVAKQQTVDAFERAYLARLVAETPQVGQAATRAGLDRKTLYRLLKKHGLGTHGEKEDGSDDETPLNV